VFLKQLELLVEKYLWYIGKARLPS